MNVIRFFLFLGLVSSVVASVIFPYGQSSIRYRRTRFKDHEAVKKSSRRQYDTNIMRRQARSVATHGIGMINNFGPVRSGGVLLLGVTAIRLAKFLRSEVFSRALYFWVHAGPIVVHYKFTRWFLKKTKAPLESESILLLNNSMSFLTKAYLCFRAQ